MDVAERLNALDERVRAIEERLAVKIDVAPEPLRLSPSPRENVLSLTG
ncbi:MAG: hypothetical protein QOE68_2745, partial [Thermoanaerobaculia bacterium]|nr:hypothetical protein [Thermoanaerobaculia bacterium]